MSNSAKFVMDLDFENAELGRFKFIPVNRLTETSTETRPRYGIGTGFVSPKSKILLFRQQCVVSVVIDV
jgi:hypothetical protein